MVLQVQRSVWTKGSHRAGPVIDDLPKAVREALQVGGKFKDDLDPIRLVSDDVVGIVHDTEILQLTLDAFHAWAQKNQLRWNPAKSQILCITANADVTREEIHLGGTPLKWVDEVEYLGLRLSKKVFLGKQPNDVKKNCKSAVYLLTNK